MLRSLKKSLCCSSRPRSRSDPQMRASGPGPGKQPLQQQTELDVARESLRLAVEGVDDPTAPPQVRLMRAGPSGNVKVVQEYLQEGKVDVHKVMNKQEDTILHQASNSGQTAVVQQLITTFKGTRDEQVLWINQRNNAHETALFLASGAGHLEVVKLLLGAGADVNLANFYGETPLYLAAYWGHESVVNHLLHGIDNPPVLRANADGTTPAGIAAVRGHREVAKLIDRFVRDRLSTGNSRVFGAWGLGTVTVKQVPYVSATIVDNDAIAPTVGELQQRVSASSQPLRSVGSTPTAAPHTVSVVPSDSGSKMAAQPAPVVMHSEGLASL